jgi:hypothetical protein
MSDKTTKNTPPPARDQTSRSEADEVRDEMLQSDRAVSDEFGRTGESEGTQPQAPSPREQPAVGVNPLAQKADVAQKPDKDD